MSTQISNSTSSLSPIQLQLGKILRQHEPNATRLFDYFNYVKVFHYNSNEFRWENNPHIEGNFFAYEKQQIIDNHRSSMYAFAVINREQRLIQEIPWDMSAHADKLRLFYEIVRNNKCEVFCLNFLNENECQRVYAFINRSIENAKEQQQSRAVVPQKTEQVVPANIPRQQTPVNIRNASTPSHSTVQQSIPVINGNSNTEDPTSSLKRLLNIPSPNHLDQDWILPQQQSTNLLPPSAFQALPFERDNQLTREHIRHVFLHLVQENEQFMNMIHQACITHQ